MAFEWPKAANDNYSPGELREQRKRSLLESGVLVTQVRDWIQKKRGPIITPRSSFEEKGTEREEVAVSLDVLQAAMAKADLALDTAEKEIDSLDAFEEAEKAVEDLRVAFEEVSQAI